MIIAALILIALFLATWWLSVKLDNYSFVDVTWSLAFAPVAVWLAYSGSGWLTRRYAIALLVAAWSLRLGIHLWRRVASHHPKEDVRYAVLRDKWQAHPSRAFFWFFLAQAVLVWLLMLPVYLITQQSTPSFHATGVAWSSASGRLPSSVKASPMHSSRTLSGRTYRPTRHLQSRSLALQPAPQLLLPEPTLVGTLSHGPACHLGLDSHHRPISYAALFAQRHRYPPHRKTLPTKTRRRFPPLSTNHQRLRPLVSQSPARLIRIDYRPSSRPLIQLMRCETLTT
jgi:hypothetical protein